MTLVCGRPAVRVGQLVSKHSGFEWWVQISESQLLVLWSFIGSCNDLNKLHCHVNEGSKNYFQSKCKYCSNRLWVLESCSFHVFNDTQYKICEADCSLKSNPELIFVKCHTKMNIVAPICITQTCAQIYDIRLVRVIGISVQVHFSGCLGIELFGITGLVWSKQYQFIW